MNQVRPYVGDSDDAAAELKAWRKTFGSGFDFLKMLPRIGVAINERHQPDPEAARDAWGRLGDAFLAAHEPGPRGEPWALRTFGTPAEAARLRRPSGRKRP